MAAIRQLQLYMVNLHHNVSILSPQRAAAINPPLITLSFRGRVNRKLISMDYHLPYKQATIN
jgi:hypothetical protein